MSELAAVIRDQMAQGREVVFLPHPYLGGVIDLAFGRGHERCTYRMRIDRELASDPELADRYLADTLRVADDNLTLRLQGGLRS